MKNLSYCIYKNFIKYKNKLMTINRMYQVYAYRSMFFIYFVLRKIEENLAQVEVNKKSPSQT